MKKDENSMNKKVKCVPLFLAVLICIAGSLSGCSGENNNGWKAAGTPEKTSEWQTNEINETGVSAKNETETKIEPARMETEMETEFVPIETEAEKVKTETIYSDGVNRKKEVVTIELDPGHGGSQSGAENEETGVLEKEINLKIAKYLKAELETYQNVKVFLTREDDRDVKLEDRVKKAVQDHADVLISLHNNATGPMADYDHGCTVLTGRGAYNRQSSQTGQELGCYILKALSDIGLENQGLMFRVCQNQTRYPNGTLCDYYSIVRNSELSDIPGIIVEHSFIDNKQEFQTYLSDEQKIRRIAQADATGIASYFSLESKFDEGEELLKLRDYNEKITLITSEDKKDNEYMFRNFFQN